ncbi:hypothetical protein [Sphingomonas beigongshangi]|uniref:hypothetical protein n=1 Tax=Sphingomonas beigongshangi TaxID=2782540 RepID=UPI00193B9131|nr:hypothetical protein [Sphingomonas beigongshangi]
MPIQSVPPIAAGYAYRVRLQVTGEDPVFPVGCRLRAQVRPFVGSTHVAGTLTTENGGITRIDDQTVELELPEALTANIDNDAAWLDLARADLDPDEWIPVQIKLPVITPVTEPEA